MPTPITNKLPSAQGVAAGQTATLNCPLGLKYQQLLIRAQYDNTGTPTDIPVANWSTYVDEIRLLIDGDTKIRATAAELVTLAQYYGQTLIAGALPIFLSRPWMRTVTGEDAPGYGTFDVQSMTLEVDLVSGWTVDKFEVYAEQGPNEPLGAHYTLRQYSFSQGTTGEREVSEIKRGNYAIFAAHLNTANVDKIEFEANQRKLVEVDRVVAEAIQEQTGRVHQSGWTHTDFARRDRIGDALPMALQDFRARYNFTGTGTFKIFTENLETHIAGQ